MRKAGWVLATISTVILGWCLLAPGVARADIKLGMPSANMPGFEVSISNGYSFEACFKNTGNQTGLGGISISFPFKKSSSDKNNVSKGSGTSSDMVYSEHPKGSPIWHKDGSQLYASYLLVECEDNSWSAGEKNCCEVDVNVGASDIGPEEVYFRAWYKKNVDGSFAAPLFGFGLPTKKGQQGWTETIKSFEIVECVFAEDCEAGENCLGSVCVDALPDLYVKELVGPVECTEVGEKASVDIVFKNKGAGDVNLSSWNYTNYTAKIGGSPCGYGFLDCQGDDCFIGEDLKSGETSTEDAKCKVPSSGCHTVEVFIDSDYDVEEANEDNNKKTVEICACTPPDLIVETIDVTSDPIAGETYNVTLTAKNIGQTDAAKSKIRLKDNGALVDWGDVPNGGVLSPGETATEWISWTPIGSGSHKLEAEVDFEDVVDEANEQNNTATKTVSVAAPPQPDLVVSDFWADPGFPVFGETVKFTAEVTNVGGVWTGFVAINLDYYMDGEVCDSGTIYNGLGAGSTATDITTKCAPDSPGLHYVDIVVDTNDDVPNESNEFNNQGSLEVYWEPPPQPDLVVSDIWTESDVLYVGESNTFYAKFENVGLADASAEINISYFLDGVECDTDTLWNLGAEGEKTESTSSCNPDTDGQHKLTVEVDVKNDVPDEALENNNSLDASFEWEMPPNELPLISKVAPLQTLLYVPLFDVVEFSVEAFDSDGDVTHIEWIIDGSSVAIVDESDLDNGVSPVFAQEFHWTGEHEVKAVVFDDMDATALVSWVVNVSDPPSLPGNVPYFSQSWCGWCYITSVAMVLNYYGIQVKPREVAASTSLGSPSCNVGVSFPDVLDYLEFDEGIPGAAINSAIWPDTNDPEQLEDWPKCSENALHKLRRHLRDSIGDGHPVLLGVFAVSHAVVVVGMDESSIFIHEPGGALLDAASPTGKLSSDYAYAAIPWESFFDVACAGEAGLVTTISLEGLAPDESAPSVTVDILDAFALLFKNHLGGQSNDMLLFEWDGSSLPDGYVFKLNGSNPEPYHAEFPCEEPLDILGFCPTLADKMSLTGNVSNSSPTAIEAKVALVSTSTQGEMTILSTIEVSLDGRETNKGVSINDTAMAGIGPGFYEISLLTYSQKGASEWVEQDSVSVKLQVLETFFSSPSIVFGEADQYVMAGASVPIPFDVCNASTYEQSYGVTVDVPEAWNHALYAGGLLAETTGDGSVETILLGEDACESYELVLSAPNSSKVGEQFELKLRASSLFDVWYFDEAAIGITTIGPECGDDLCNGEESCGTCDDCSPCCGDELCQEEAGETCDTCPDDCNKCCGNDVCEPAYGESCSDCADCPPCPTDCGDGFCANDEDCDSCPGDCDECCGNLACEEWFGENCYNCAGDCGGCCDNGKCETSFGENCDNCPEDCEDCCGDKSCDYEYGDTCQTCPSDCGPCPAECGDKSCTGQENCLKCPGDCGECCGNGQCDKPLGESCVGCEEDCGTCCGNGDCEAQLDEDCESCSEDCGSCCGNNDCQPLKNEDCNSCPGDCGKCPDECGNGQCEDFEDCQLCPGDCGECCGDLDCSAGHGEDCKSCSGDCGECCGNEKCDELLGESCTDCPGDCGTCCGNGICEPALDEGCLSCEEDCKSCCGNGICEPDYDEDCASCENDCGKCPPKCGNGQLEPEGNEACDDGNLDNSDGCSEDCTLEIIKVGSIIFTEIMADPSVVSDAAGEWLEIYNTEKFKIGLDGWAIKAAGGYEVTVADGAGLVIQAGQYLVFGGNSDDQTNGGVQIDYQYNNLSLLNAGETLSIHQPNDPESIDGAGYSKEIFPNHVGHSISLHPQFLEGGLNDDAANWCLSTSALPMGDKGTPGEANDPCYGYCGDGDIDQDAGELCDDGLLNSNVTPDACRLDCTLPECGDGVPDSDEECDSGESNSDTQPNACRTDCKQPSCGDSVKDLGEACDDGAQNSNSIPDACRKDCVLPDCGDGVTDSGEECDDGNTADGDGCDGLCKKEVAPPECGDGNVDDSEECDDGNKQAGDGCDASCKLEPEPECGDGKTDPGEECDDGNKENGDGCDASCQLEPGPTCGDGNTDLGEECDDGNNVDGDGCDKSCQLEDEPDPVCGNGKKEAGEECDDGNKLNDDGCSKNCTIEDEWCGDEICNGDELCDVCIKDCGKCSTCGDGVEDPGEECDDGNLDTGDGCSALCELEIVAVGDIIITELMIDTAGDNQDKFKEWVEVYNITSFPIDLKGWTLQDKPDGAESFYHVIGEDVLVEPGSYAVLGKSSDLAENGGIPVDYAYGADVKLKDEGGTLYLRGAAEEEDFVLDGITYDAAEEGYGGFATFGKGYSRVLDQDSHDFTANDDAANWCMAFEMDVLPDGENYGTPGSANPYCSAPDCKDGICKGEENCKTCPDDCSCEDDELCLSDECCSPDCSDVLCDHTNDCGQTCGCDAGLLCCDNGQCLDKCDEVCVPDCEGKECGADGCQESCGECAGNLVCSAGTCKCPVVQECGGACCAADETCCEGDVCSPDCPTCTPDCAGTVCGDDGCGGSCGKCAGCGMGCVAGACADIACDGRSCGPDGCGGSCGYCGAGQECTNLGGCVGGPGVDAWLDTISSDVADSGGAAGGTKPSSGGCNTNQNVPTDPLASVVVLALLSSVFLAMARARKQLK